MKSHLLLTAIVLFLTTTGCKKDDKTVDIDLSYNAVFDIPANYGVYYDIDLESASFDTDSEQAFKDNNTSAELVKKIQASSIALRITSPNDGTFDIFEEFSVYLVARGQQDALLGTITTPSGSGVMYFDLETKDVQNYLTESTASLRLTTRCDEFSATDYELTVNAIFAVSAIEQ